jgi:hypothetical protein
VGTCLIQKCPPEGGRYTDQPFGLFTVRALDPSPVFHKSLISTCYTK